MVPVVPKRSPGPGSCAGNAVFDAFSDLGRHPNITLSGLAGLSDDGRRTPVYLRSILMLVDGARAAIGSANLHRFSLQDNGELNAWIHAPAFVRASRVALLKELLDSDTEGMDGVSAPRAFLVLAEDNRRRLAARDPSWRGWRSAFTSSHRRQPVRRA